MNLLNLLVKEKRIAGIEISDSIVRVAFLRPTKKHFFKKQRDTSTSEELILIEEPIAANIIERGVVVDQNLLGKTLRNICNKAKLGTPYAIVSIPDDQIYSRTFSFPKTVEGMRLTDAMKLAISFQLPQKTEEVFLDWERTGGTTATNEILLSTIPRSVAEGYIKALDIAGIKTIALESHLASLARTIKTPDHETILYTKKTPDGVTIFALKDGIPRFARTLPQVFVPEKELSKEIANIRSALEASQESDQAIKTLDVLDSAIKDEYITRPELSSDPMPTKWLIALGSSVRGRIKEGEDNLISLLPVGTEEAYAYQKATAFITLLRNMTLGVSVFFVIAYVAAYIFTLSLSQNAERAIATLSITPTSPELLKKEAWVQHINDMTSTGEILLGATPLWSKVIEEVRTRMIDGIIALNFSAQNINEPITIIGQAKDRATLNQLKKTFQESPLFTEVDIPITNLEQRNDIPFSLTFRIKDLNALYYANN